ncbi:hypothetical protein GCM10010339_47380 [Streptomyces alanosinicus]|uniref:Uncharacterized protein n=1 Tax=Streptomyces alanosinicus TaxID=68171 RepID=A0A919D5E1_9ACTN|nr:hypothetical protein GCM10010339_47380 [Streptomyces alanosinicus]
MALGPPVSGPAARRPIHTKKPISSRNGRNEKSTDNHVAASAAALAGFDLHMMGGQVLLQLSPGAQRGGELGGEPRAVLQGAADRSLVVDVDRLHLAGTDLADEVAVGQ